MIRFLIFHFINMGNHIYLFAYIEPSLHPRDKYHLIMAYDSLNVLLNLICLYFIENFASIFVSDIGL